MILASRSGCRYLQVDDPPMATLCNEKFQKHGEGGAEMIRDIC